MLLKDKVKHKISLSFTWFLVFNVLIYVFKLPVNYVPLIFLVDIVVTTLWYLISVPVEK
jgi:hypothetical protein